MTPTQQAEIMRLNREIPNPWIIGQWYDAQMNGQPVQIKRTTAIKGGEYLHVRRRGTQVVRTCDTREVIDSRPCWFMFRVNLTTFDVKEI